ncbi:hypothetical protein HPSH_03495 [Helicobacter pylori Shi470]|nr:hypothetical protein HPSH_03495 [Helicobacter pylori Shi470]
MGMVVGSEEMENADNGNECFMPVPILFFENKQELYNSIN